MATKIKAGEDFLGEGLYGPLRIGSNGDFDTKAGRDLVAQSVKAILSTAARYESGSLFMAGSRFMRDDFGNTSKTLRHENLDFGTIAIAESIYIEAIEKWEPRAEVSGISSTIDENALTLESTISIFLKSINETLNLVIIRDAKGNVNFKTIEGV